MKHIRLIVLVLALLTVSPGLDGWAGPPQQTHDLGLAPRTVHWGYYDGGLSPVLTIASGDIVRVETLIARGLERLLLAGAPEDEIPDRLKVVERGGHRSRRRGAPDDRPDLRGRCGTGRRRGDPHPELRNFCTRLASATFFPDSELFRMIFLTHA